MHHVAPLSHSFTARLSLSSQLALTLIASQFCLTEVSARGQGFSLKNASMSSALSLVAKDDVVICVVCVFAYQVCVVLHTHCAREMLCASCIVQRKQEFTQLHIFVLHVCVYTRAHMCVRNCEDWKAKSVC